MSTKAVVQMISPVELLIILPGVRLRGDQDRRWWMKGHIELEAIGGNTSLHGDLGIEQLIMMLEICYVYSISLDYDHTPGQLVVQVRQPNQVNVVLRSLKSILSSTWHGLEFETAEIDPILLRFRGRMAQLPDCFFPCCSADVWRPTRL